MTNAAFKLLLYLDRYLDEDKSRWRELAKLYEKHTGRVLHYPNLWRHLKRKVEPNLSATLVYQIFLHQHKEFIPSKIPGDLFTYKNPKWLKVKK